MHNVKDVKKMNALSHARAPGRLIRKIQLSDRPKCSRIESIRLSQSAPSGAHVATISCSSSQDIGVGGPALQI